MQLGVIEVPTLKELFIEKIEEQILTGQLKVGDSLPSERQLQEETHISKTVIHAGLVELEQKGFLEIIPRKGTVVANYKETGTMDTLNALIRHNGGAMTREQSESFLESRIAIEGSAMKRLAECATEEDLAFLESLLAEAESRSSARDTEGTAAALFSFHRGICVRSGNEFFPLLLNEFKPIIMAFWANSLKMFGAEANINLARRYLEDIRRGDGNSAHNRLVKSVNEYLICCNGQ